MIDQPLSASNLLAELDAQQDEVLAQLDELNARIEKLLGNWAGQREPLRVLHEPAAGA